MWIGTLLAVACGWLFLCASPRFGGPLQGWRGTVLGMAAALLAVWQMHARGLGLPAAAAQALAVAMLALPCLSYLAARRRRADRGAAR